MDTTFFSSAYNATADLFNSTYALTTENFNKLTSKLPDFKLPTQKDFCSDSQDSELHFAQKKVCEFLDNAGQFILENDKSFGYGSAILGGALGMNALLSLKQGTNKLTNLSIIFISAALLKFSTDMDSSESTMKPQMITAALAAAATAAFIKMPSTLNRQTFTLKYFEKKIV